jgi:GNAT superfamily N-acetyltransferase
MGHSTTPGHVSSRWPQFDSEGNSALVAVGSDDVILGVATLHKMTVLYRATPVGRITLLIVDEPSRGQGIGRALVDAAEEVFARSGCGLMEITSNQRLTAAHAFYQRLGFKQTSFRFAKELEPIAE